ncbi:NAD(P)H-binding protein [Streptomyces sp. NPDC057074]|uniref:NAD(P)H-binding protein n=1 Tax=Streptomyces sp. NPDC057074 TaxID=3346015 RepID=UPI003640734A
MTRLCVIGATGGVGNRLIHQLVARSDDVLALHRSPGQARMLAAVGVRPVQGDLTQLDTAQPAGRLRGCDTVVFTAGAPDPGPAAADAVDGRGHALALNAVLVAGVPHFVHLSAFPDAWRDQNLGGRLRALHEGQTPPGRVPHVHRP